MGLRFKRLRLAFAVTLCLLIALLLLLLTRDAGNFRSRSSWNLEESYDQSHRWYDSGLFHPFQRFDNNDTVLNGAISQTVALSSPNRVALIRSNSREDTTDSGHLDTGSPQALLSKQIRYAMKSTLVQRGETEAEEWIKFEGEKSSGTLPAENRDRKKSEFSSPAGEEFSTRPTQVEKKKELIVVYRRPWFVHSTEAVSYTHLTLPTSDLV